MAGADGERISGLREFGRRLGVAFQCADDVLGIRGRTARSGRPVGADLAARKKSLPVVAALSGEGAAAERLRALYAATHPLDEQEVDLARELVEEAAGPPSRRPASGVGRAARPVVGAAHPDAYRQLRDMTSWSSQRTVLGEVGREGHRAPAPGR
ncbi:polyprenyl synthetase family protein [Streptomyces sp. NPDC050416]|uniref:polyprenyl synthetase family protein n=1 Tax=Streptomyces sp. NPDC050416 TaxID=3365611 RepID=UPI00378D9D34